MEFANTGPDLVLHAHFKTEVTFGSNGVNHTSWMIGVFCFARCCQLCNFVWITNPLKLG